MQLYSGNSERWATMELSVGGGETNINNHLEDPGCNVIGIKVAP
jgi:hypothetical protein